MWQDVNADVRDVGDFHLLTWILGGLSNFIYANYVLVIRVCGKQSGLVSKITYFGICVGGV